MPNCLSNLFLKFSSEVLSYLASNQFNHKKHGYFLKIWKTLSFNLVEDVKKSPLFFQFFHPHQCGLV